MRSSAARPTTTALCARFFEGYVRLEPEDATTLGVLGEAHRLSDPSESGAADELAFHRGVLAELDSLSPESPDEVLDVHAMASHSRFRAHALAELGLHRTCLEASLFPNAMLGHLAARANTAETWESARQRLLALPAYFRGLEGALGAGLAAGPGPSAEIGALFERELLPGAASHVGALPAAAARAGVEGAPLEALERAARGGVEALQSHREFYQRTLLPKARGAFAIGTDEVRFRLGCFFGMTESPAELVALAEDELRAANDALVAATGRLSARTGGNVASMAEAGAVLRTLWSEHPDDLDGVVSLYRSALLRIEPFVRARALYPWPDGAALAFCPIPEGMVHGGNATNWPAPLRGPGGAAFVAYAPRREAHSRAGAACLFAHEGLPGHALQSLVWQRVFGADPSPVRFVAVCDDVAIARQYFGPMMNVEGWAVRAEERLFEEGLFDEAESVLAVASRGIRWARVVADLGLHTGRFDLGGAASWLAEATGMPLGWCDSQVIRYARIPLQAITYALGARGFERLRALRPAEPEMEFHRRVLEVGTAPPALLERLWARDGGEVG